MNTPSFESNVILEVHTQNVSVVIRSRDRRVSVDQDSATVPSSSLDISAFGLKRVKVGLCDIDLAYDAPTDMDLSPKVCPLFFEQTDYEMIVQSKDGESVSFRHENSLVRENVGPVTEEIAGLISGIVRFDNSTGFNCLDIYYKDSKHISLCIEVFPSNINYKDDYIRMLEDISNASGTFGRVDGVSVRDTALLYEYWCFVKLVSILRAQGLETVGDSAVNADNTDISVSSVMGETQEIGFINRSTDERITLVYKPSVSELTVTGCQGPSFMLELEKKESGRRYKYIFDAKYRLESHPDALYPDKSIGPIQEDIDDLHKYRDAIVYDSKSEDAYRYNREILGAYVLFPYGEDEEKYGEHCFYKSIEHVNIGGLPFLPKKTRLVEKLLKELVDESGSSALERAILPAEIADSLNQVKWDARDVLIGSLRSREQLEINIRDGYYYAPATVMVKENFPIRYVALYQSKRFFGDDAGIRYYGEVISTTQVKRRQIPIPPSGGNGDDIYYVFKVRCWQSLDTPITELDESLYVPKYTNKFLLEHCTHSYELFNIRNEEEFKLMQELKRVLDSAEAEENDSTPVYSPDAKHSILVKDGSLIVLGDNDRPLMKISISEFKRSLGRSFGKIVECLRKKKTDKK